MCGKEGERKRLKQRKHIYFAGVAMWERPMAFVTLPVPLTLDRWGHAGVSAEAGTPE